MSFDINISKIKCSGKHGIYDHEKQNDQEFLVEKKNPLALPPDYDKLPTPGNEKVSPSTFSENNEVKDLLNIEESDSNNDNDSSGDIESSIIEKIQ